VSVSSRLADGFRKLEGRRFERNVLRHVRNINTENFTRKRLDDEVFRRVVSLVGFQAGGEDGDLGWGCTVMCEIGDVFLASMFLGKPSGSFFLTKMYETSIVITSCP
jgi:hypothetical protein